MNSEELLEYNHRQLRDVIYNTPNYIDYPNWVEYIAACDNRWIIWRTINSDIMKLKQLK